METITSESELLSGAGFFWRESVEGLRAVVCEPLQREGFANAFSTRVGGVSPFPQDALNLAGFDQDSAENIHENRRRFFRLLDGEWTLAACWQVHGSEVHVVRDSPDPRSEQTYCDALVSRASGVLLGVKTADCVPILLADARTGSCAAVHAGWRGTLAEIVKHALARMTEEFGTRPTDVRAALGPAALGCCYEVGTDVIQAFEEKFSYARELFTPTREGHALVDLHAASRQQLIESGVKTERVHAVSLCTICRPDLFFSYRRDKQLLGKSGRLLSVIGKTKAVGKSVSEATEGSQYRER